MTVLQKRVQELMETNLKVPAQSIDVDVPFEELDLDSLALLEFCVVLEKEFGVPVEDDDVQATFTLEDTVAMLSAKGVPA